jgi:hypothetical protein
MRGIFISKPHAGQIYIAERSRRGSRRLLWSVMPHAPVAADVRIKVQAVPLKIRRQGYRVLDSEW